MSKNCFIIFLLYLFPWLLRPSASLTVSFSATSAQQSVQSLYWQLPSMWAIEGEGLKKERSSSNPGQQVNPSVPQCFYAHLNTCVCPHIHNHWNRHMQTHTATYSQAQFCIFCLSLSLYRSTDRQERQQQQVLHNYITALTSPSASDWCLHFELELAIKMIHTEYKCTKHEST